MYPNALKDCLHNLSEKENNNLNAAFDNRLYYRGLIVGIISALMEKGHSFQMACTIVKDNLPIDCIDLDDNHILPDGWQSEFETPYWRVLS